MSPGVTCNTQKHYSHILSLGKAPEISKEGKRDGKYHANPILRFRVMYTWIVFSVVRNAQERILSIGANQTSKFIFKYCVTICLRSLRESTTVIQRTTYFSNNGNRFSLSLSSGLWGCLTHGGTYTQKNSLCEDIPPNFLSLVMHCCSLQFKTFEHFFGLLGEFLFFCQMFRQCSKQRLSVLTPDKQLMEHICLHQGYTDTDMHKQVQKCKEIYY